MDAKLANVFLGPAGANSNPKVISALLCTKDAVINVSEDLRNALTQVSQFAPKELVVLTPKEFMQLMLEQNNGVKNDPATKARVVQV